MAYGTDPVKKLIGIISMKNHTILKQADIGILTKWLEDHFIGNQKSIAKYVFCIQKDVKIPSSTNSLESFFGHLKGNLNIHRGLSLKNRKNFLKWYLYYKNQINK